MSPLERFHYHVADDETTADDLRAAPPEAFADTPPPADPADAPAEGPPAVSFTSNESAARYYLDRLLQRDERSTARAVVAPERPERVPGLVLDGEQDLRVLGTRQIRMTQTHEGIPVFGAGAVVELTDSRDLVSMSASFGEVAGVEPVETLSRVEALARVAAYVGEDTAAPTTARGRLTWYQEERTERWHLAWLLSGVAAEPPVARADAPSDEDAGFGRPPGPLSYTYLVDAHDGEILFAYSDVATAMPTRCKGIDEDEVEQSFFGRLLDGNGPGCALDDPLRAVRTFDLGYADLDQNPALPAGPVAAASGDYGTTNRAAVSAHVNASRVQDFYKLVLQRDGIDDQGMELVSLVNVTASSMGTPPLLLNAFWWQQKMWYGQVRRGERLVSLSRFLDVIAHELTHGVVETTAKLVYQTQSGALNESFADIAGVIINNWYTAPSRNDVSTWSWEIGPGLRSDGRPLRDFSDPSRLGHPAHMDDFRHLGPGELPNRANDQGWVHLNSNIHNKAIHNLLTTEHGGARMFAVEDVAVLTYLGMMRLTPRATFVDALQSVVDVAQTYFGGHQDRATLVEAVRDAYRRVGIL